MSTHLSGRASAPHIAQLTACEPSPGPVAHPAPALDHLVPPAFSTVRVPTASSRASDGLPCCTAPRTTPRPPDPCRPFTVSPRRPLAIPGNPAIPGPAGPVGASAKAARWAIAPARAFHSLCVHAHVPSQQNRGAYSSGVVPPASSLSHLSHRERHSGKASPPQRAPRLSSLTSASARTLPRVKTSLRRTVPNSAHRRTGATGVVPVQLRTRSVARRWDDGGGPECARNVLARADAPAPAHTVHTQAARRCAACQ